MLEYPFAWRPQYLPYVCNMYKDEFETGEFLKNINFYNFFLCGKLCSNDVLQIGGYDTSALVMSFPSGKKVREKLSEKMNMKTVMDNKTFIEEVFQAVYTSIFKDVDFEERYIYLLETLGDTKAVQSYTYPKENKKEYFNALTKYIARDHGSNKASRNLEKLKDPQIQFHWDTCLGKKLLRRTC